MSTQLFCPPLSRCHTAPKLSLAWYFMFQPKPGPGASEALSGPQDSLLRRRAVPLLCAGRSGAAQACVQIGCEGHTSHQNVQNYIPRRITRWPFNHVAVGSHLSHIPFDTWPLHNHQGCMATTCSHDHTDYWTTLAVKWE